MASNPKRLLLVEGINDESFYRAIISKYGLNASVHIATPKNQGAKFNSKNGAINHLPVLLKNLEDGSMERIGLIVDADLQEFNQGFEATLNTVVSKITPLGFSSKPTALKDGGLVFDHPDGLPKFGLWIMPNNKDEGVLENWIKKSVLSSEKNLMALAEKAVNALKDKKFGEHRNIKAEIATWLAWQEKPGEGLYYSVEGELLDTTSTDMAGLLAWMKQVFNN